MRFVCFQTIHGHRSRLGLFQAIDLAHESEHAEAWALSAIDETNDWFRANLATPPQFDRDWVTPSAERDLSWFKPGAAEHIRRMHELKAALEACGVHVEVITTRRPGIVTYEDEHQITAAPYGQTF